MGWAIRARTVKNKEISRQFNVRIFRGRLNGRGIIERGNRGNVKNVPRFSPTVSNVCTTQHGCFHLSLVNHVRLLSIFLIVICGCLTSRIPCKFAQPSQGATLGGMDPRRFWHGWGEVRKPLFEPRSTAEVITGVRPDGFSPGALCGRAFVGVYHNYSGTRSLSMVSERKGKQTQTGLRFTGFSGGNRAQGMSGCQPRKETYSSYIYKGTRLLPI